MNFSATPLSTDIAPNGAAGNGHLPTTMMGAPPLKTWSRPQLVEMATEDAPGHDDGPAPDIDDHAALRGMIELLHNAARRAAVDGILITACFDPLDGNKKVIRHFAIGDVDGMTTELATRGQFMNAYVALAILRKDLPLGARGKKEDIVAQLGLAIDDDGDVVGKRAGRPFGIEESVLLRTCSKPTINFQPFYLFTRALSPQEAEKFAELTYRKCGGDFGTKDNSHVWRVPDTLNFPNAAKLKRGRPERPQNVELIGGSFELVDPDHYRRSLEAMPDRHPPCASKSNGKERTQVGGSTDCDEISVKLPLWLTGLVDTEVVEGQGDRSAHCFHVMMALMEQGLSDAEVHVVAHGAPFATKFTSRGDLDAGDSASPLEVERRGETGTEQRQRPNENANGR